MSTENRKARKPKDNVFLSNKKVKIAPSHFPNNDLYQSNTALYI